MRASSAAPAGAALLAFAGLAAYSGRWLAAARSPATLSLRAEGADAADAFRRGEIAPPQPRKKAPPRLKKKPQPGAPSKASTKVR